MNHLEHFKTEILPLKEKFFRVAYGITGDASESEDVVQDVFIKVWNLRFTWSKYDNLQGWVMQMIKNKSIDKTRSKHRKTTSLEGTYNMVLQHKTPEQSAVLSDAIYQIEKLISKLPKKQQQIMRLRDFEHFSYREIAEELNIPINQVKVNLSRARKYVRISLEKLQFNK